MTSVAHRSPLHRLLNRSGRQVEVDPPQAERQRVGARNGSESQRRQRSGGGDGADQDDRFAQRNDEEQAIALGQMSCIERYPAQLPPEQPGREQVDCASGEPESDSRRPVEKASSQHQWAGDEQSHVVRVARHVAEWPAQCEQGENDSCPEVGGSEQDTSTPVCTGHRECHEQARHADDEQAEPVYQGVHIVCVGVNADPDPGPVDRNEDHQGLQEALSALVGAKQLGDLGDDEHVDDVEEQLSPGDAFRRHGTGGLGRREPLPDAMTQKHLFLTYLLKSALCSP